MTMTTTMTTRKKSQKVQIKAYIPMELDDRLRRFIAQRSDRYHGGDISEYIRLAIEKLLNDVEKGKGKGKQGELNRGELKD